MSLLSPSQREPVRIAPLHRLKRFAASAWAISFASFAVTALALQSHGLALV